MASFANGTTVSVEKSRMEVEGMLVRVGATQFATMTDFDKREATIGFRWKSINIRMRILLPDRQDKAFTGWRPRIGTPSETRAQADYDAEVRRRWRCLALALKAKIVAVQDKVTTFENEFLPYMVTETGETVAERMQGQVKAAIAGGSMLMLPPGQDDVQDAEFTAKD